MSAIGEDLALRPCPSCGASWKRTELVSEARRGGGYRVLCHECDHEWDDTHASHGARDAARRAEQRDLLRRAAVEYETEKVGGAIPRWLRRLFRRGNAQ